MSTTKLNPIDRAFVNAMGELLMKANDRNDANTAQGSTYGHLSNAIRAFVLNQTGVTLGDVNWLGYTTRADDVQAAIDAAKERDRWADEALDDGYSSNPGREDFCRGT